jgi:hypothetical protein
MSSSIGLWIGDTYVRYPIASPADLTAVAAASAYGIKGAVNTYADLPAASSQGEGEIYIVRDGTGAPGGANGLYQVQSGAWVFLDALNLQDSDEVPNKSGVTGAKVTNALNTLNTAKADKVGSATAGHFAALDASGNLTDSGSNAASFDATGAAAAVASVKADKVGSATAGHFAGLDTNGNLTDSGDNAASFDAAGAAAGAVSGHTSAIDHTLIGVSKMVATNLLEVAATVTKSLLVVPAGLTSLLSLDVSAATQIVAGAGESITVDVLKNGVSILSAPILIDSAVAAKTAVVGLITTSALAVGDFIEVAYTYTVGGTPTPMSGIAVSFTFKGK